MTVAAESVFVFASAIDLRSSHFNGFPGSDNDWLAASAFPLSAVCVLKTVNPIAIIRANVAEKRMCSSSPGEPPLWNGDSLCRGLPGR
jgi:hypothetical protein